MKRRPFLALCAGGVASTAGCFATDSSENTTDQSGSNNDSYVHSSSCKDGRERLTREYTVPDVEYGELAGFALSTSPQSVQQGDEITIDLANRTEAQQTTSVKYHYDIHRRDDNEWQSLFWKDKGVTVGVNDRGVNHGSGEGFGWTLTMTDKGLTHRKEGTELLVCAPVVAGPYRFVFRGVATFSEGKKEAILGTQFTVTEQ